MRAAEPLGPHAGLRKKKEVVRNLPSLPPFADCSHKEVGSDLLCAPGDIADLSTELRYR